MQIENEPDGRIDETATDSKTPTSAADHRERAAGILDQLTREAKVALARDGIELGVFFVVPSAGAAVLQVGTLADPDDGVWERVTTIIRTILKDLTGLDNAPGRDLACAMSD